MSLDDITFRIQKILDYYSLSASAFADKISIQRSGISHLLSGRNKPSLDFIAKVYENFPEINLYWLLYGKGNFLLENEKKYTTQLKEDINVNSNQPNLFSESEKNIVENTTSNEFENSHLQIKKDDKKIEQIAIFYSDGSCSVYKPN